MARGGRARAVRVPLYPGGGGPYRLAAAPDTPVRALELPAAAGLLVEGLRFVQLRFRYVYSVAPDVLRMP
ncbi:MAG TPA: hypothetical protein VMT11_09410 [Myxococcaceae bacterium]|nr:hypothetical protein [Myxococcaceae bacterium]